MANIKKKQTASESTAPVETAVDSNESIQPGPSTVSIELPEEPLTIGSGSVTVLTKPAGKPAVDTSLVKVTISYPEDFRGKRYLVEGKSYEVSRESAQQFVRLGIASIEN